MGGSPHSGPLFSFDNIRICEESADGRDQDPPMIDPRLTQSVGLYQFAGLTSNRLVRYAFSDEATGPSDMSLKGDLAESWQSDATNRVWTFKLRQGVKWQNVAPLNGRELTAADVKYCFEAYAKEG